VEVLTGVGEEPHRPQHSYGMPPRAIAVCPNHFQPYIATTSRQAVFVANGKEKAINCEIGSVLEPQRLVWIQLPTRS
jgi:hypothetical protein